MAIDEKIGNQLSIATALNNIAIILVKKGEYDEALEKYKLSMEINKKLGDQPGIAYTQVQIGLLYSYMSKKEDAIESTQKALDIFEKIGLENEARKAKAQIKKLRL
jgi:tetratricopeptide (TPR) repeat protein